MKSFQKIFNRTDSPLEIIEFVSQIEWDKYWVEVRKYEEALSEAQRNYYFWVVIKQLSMSETYKGYSKNDLHMLMKIRYLQDDQEILTKVRDQEPAEALLRIYNLFQDLSITQSTTWEFEAYLSKIMRWEWDKHWISIPLPNEWEWTLSHLVK